MPAEYFWTELRNSLTAFYETILMRTGAGERPVAKALISKFKDKAALVAVAVPNDDAGAKNNAAAPPAAAVDAAPAPPAPAIWILATSDIGGLPLGFYGYHSTLTQI